jgi:Trypsin
VLNFPLPGGVTGNLFRDRRIRMGTQNITAGGAVYEMERIVVHSDYSADTQVHDIALIKIKERGQTARLGGRLKKIALQSPTKPLYLNEDVWVTGWGWQAPRNPAMAGAMASASRLGVNNVIQRSNILAMQCADRIIRIGDQEWCASVPRALAAIHVRATAGGRWCDKKEVQRFWWELCRMAMAALIRTCPRPTPGCRPISTG